MSDEYMLFRLLVLGLWAIGVFNVWRMINSSPGNTIAFGGRSYSKAGFTRFVVVWNAVGLPILMLVLFVVWRP